MSATLTGTQWVCDWCDTISDDDINAIQSAGLCFCSKECANEHRYATECEAESDDVINMEKKN